MVDGKERQMRMPECQVEQFRQELLKRGEFATGG